VGAGGKVLVPTKEAIQKLVAARMAADVEGTSTLVIARTDAEAADLLTSDCDDVDKPFCTGERTPEGFYKTRPGIDQAIARALAYAPYADLLWMETATPDLTYAKVCPLVAPIHTIAHPHSHPHPRPHPLQKFRDAVHAKFPGKMLAYNCSPSFNWKKNLDDATIAKFQRELGAMGFKYQFITLAGIHSMWFNMFELAQVHTPCQNTPLLCGNASKCLTPSPPFCSNQDYTKRGMTAYVEKVQEPEFAARSRGYTFVAHQQEVGTGYFDEVTTVIHGGFSSVKALSGSTEEAQFKHSLTDAHP
jgi:isocitrate lyase